MEPSHAVCRENILSSGEYDESTILKGKFAWKNADVREKMDRAEEDLAPLTGKEGTFMEPSQEEYLQRNVLASGQYEEPKINISKIAREKTDMVRL